MLSVGTVLTALSSTAFAAQYEEKDVFNGRNWLEAFEFKQVENNFGFVNYVNEATAKSMELYKTHNDDVIFGVDGTETLDPVKDVGRKSVRLEGKTNYNKGLFILDVKQMPGVCGMWPAFWSLGQGTWPATGEVCLILLLRSLSSILNEIRLTSLRTSTTLPSTNTSCTPTSTAKSAV
jgi:hypothetical protein